MKYFKSMFITKKSKSILGIVAIILILFLLFMYVGSTFLPVIVHPSKESFKLSINGIPKTIKAGDSFNVKVILKNSTLKPYKIGYKSQPIYVWFYKNRSEHDFSKQAIFQYDILWPQSTFEEYITCTPEADGEYHLKIDIEFQINGYLEKKAYNYYEDIVINVTPK